MKRRWGGTVARRAAARVPVVLAHLVGVTVVSFFLLRAAPGDAVLVALGAGGGSNETVAALRREHGLDRPLISEYSRWVLRSARFDFGRSLRDGELVRVKVARALPTTLALSGLAALFAFGIGVPLGAALAVWQSRRGVLEPSAVLLLDLAYAWPGAAVALMALALGAPYARDSFGGLWAPALCLGLPLFARVARQQRSAVLVELDAEYVTTARAKGAGPGRVLRHTLRNALLPTITLCAHEVPVLLSGSVVVEEVFGLPGIGWLAVEAVLTRDVPVLLALVTLGASITLLALALADVFYALADPRLRRESQ